ncbi:hypothetical protein HGA91_06260 [candidate division WWE3 bacterium]|nr:hypothetical protein [candidate division WWE3 bacterium]
MNTSNDETHRGAAAYLIHWQPNHQCAVNDLLIHLENETRDGVQNYALRGLIALVEKADIPKDKLSIINARLYANATAPINKTLALLYLLLDKHKIEKSDLNNQVERIAQLATVKRPNIKTYAEKIIGI